MQNLEKIKELFMGHSEYTEQAIALIDALPLTADEFLMVTNLQNIDSFQGLEWAMRFLNSSQRKWLCAKMLEYDCTMPKVTEGEFTYKNIELAMLFPNLERIKVVRVGKLIQAQSKLSFTSLTRLNNVELDGCCGQFEFPSGVTELKIRYSELDALDLDQFPNLERLDMLVSTVKQIDSTHLNALRRLSIVDCAVDVHHIFSESHCPQLEAVELRLLKTTETQFAFLHPNLQHVSVQECDIQCIFPTPLLHLESLSLIDCASCTTLELPEFPKIQRLVVQGISIPVLELPDLPNLHHLDLSLTEIQSLDLSRIPNIQHLELQHSKIETLDCTIATSLVFLSVHGTPLKTLTGLPSTVQILMTHQTELVEKPSLSSAQYLTFADETENDWSDLATVVQHLENRDWEEAFKVFVPSMLQPLKHHFGSCLEMGRIRRLQCLLQSRHDYLDCVYTSDGKMAVTTDPGWDYECLSYAGTTSDECINVNSLQIQCLHELLNLHNQADLGDDELAKVLSFESVGNGDGEDGAELFFIDPKLPLDQLSSHQIGVHPSGLDYDVYRGNTDNFGAVRTLARDAGTFDALVNDHNILSPFYGLFQVLLWLEYRGVKQPMLPSMSSSIQFDALMIGIARDVYPVVDWQWNGIYLEAI